MPSLKDAKKQLLDFVQFPSSAIVSIVGAIAAETVNYGIGTAKRFANNLERAAAVDFRLPFNLDPEKDVAIRATWSSDVISGDAKLDTTYLWITPTTDMSAAGTEVSRLETVPGTANTPSTIDVNIGTPPEGAFGLRVRYVRDGIADTVAGNIYLIGSSLLYNIGGA